MDYYREHYGLKGWRKSKLWRSSLKSSLRSAGKACVSTSKYKAGGISTQLGEYLPLAGELDEKVEKSYLGLYQSAAFGIKFLAVLKALSYYQEMIKKHIEMIERRLLKGETIPSAEKVFSIFEPHTQWISKGKQNKKVELGHKILIATDQQHFIVHHQVIEGIADAALIIPLADKVLSKYENIDNLSLDKGFYSKENKDLLSLEIPNLVMPKKCKLNAGEKEEESHKKFKKLRNLHIAVESNIIQLEHKAVT
jgi:IS5 family transposase